MDDTCDAHHKVFKGKRHPDFGHGQSPSYGDMLPEHKRGAGHPAKHSSGKLPSQLNPDHGPHR